MQSGLAGKTYRRILVVVPNWVGDVVLATPTLAALREHFRHARITYLLRRYVADVIDGCGWHNYLMFWPQQRGLMREWRTLDLAGRLMTERYDLALLLTNSLRSALTVWRAGIPVRVGYAREGRSWFLTHRLRPLKHDGVFVPSSVLPYYAALAEHVGCAVEDRMPRLRVAPEQERRGQELLRHYGLADGARYAVINPGAKFGAAKCWLPERFAALCQWLSDEMGLTPVIVGAPGEVPLMRDIAARAGRATICMDEPGTTLGSLKVVVRQASLLLCNDTGPRHYGIAFGVPTVTIFGPTHQEWTDTGYEREIKLQASVECGPCQLPRCPIDLRCMTEITTERAMAAARSLLGHPVGTEPTSLAKEVKHAEG